MNHLVLPTVPKTMQTTAKDWDAVRGAFASSIMIETALSSLAQNLDSPDWPIKAKDETPARYVDLSLDEAIELLQLKGQPPERIDQLVAILKETLAFDAPFGEMVEQNEAAAERDNQLLKNLNRLGIPEIFPLTLTTLDKVTREFCELENLTTLAEFAVFAQGLAQNVIVGGDFRKLLNALSHIDEAALAEVLPFRPGTKGVHLAEALAQAVGAPDSATRVDAATKWFRTEIAAIEQALAAGGSLERQFVVLGQPELEKKAAALLRPYLRGAGAAKPAGAKVMAAVTPGASAAPRLTGARKKPGLFGWLFRSR